MAGIGKRATAILIVSTRGFKHTETYQQLISYAGLSPKEYTSSSTIRGKVRICKQGSSLLQHTLYMWALNAKKQIVPVRNYLTGWLQKEKIKTSNNSSSK